MSRIASLVVAGVIGGLLVGSVVWFVRPPAALPAANAESAAAATPVSPPAAVAPLGEAPPWAATSADAPPPGLGDAISTLPSDPARAAARDALRSRLGALTAGGRRPSPAEMNQLLADLERTEGSHVIGGVNIGALRSNLVKVEEMQQLGVQMKAEAEKPGGADQEKVKAILARLQKLQSEMRLDLTVPQSTPPPAR